MVIPYGVQSQAVQRNAEMDARIFAEWLSGLSLPATINALSRIYLRLTINARELFVADLIAGKEQRVEEILHGLNEIHHTLANQLAAYTNDAEQRMCHCFAGGRTY